MKINNIQNKNQEYKTPTFGALNLSPLSNALYTLNNNDMLNASFVDIFAMDTPRTIVETKYRGKQAGIEMGFREYTGTFIAEFSAIVFAMLGAKLFNKFHKPSITANNSSWVTNKGLDTFNEIFSKTDKTPSGFVDGVLDSMTGLVGSEYKKFNSIDKEKTKTIKETLTKLITENSDKKTIKKTLTNVQDDIVKLLGADNNIILKSGDKEFGANLTHVLRDTIDMGKNVFFKEGANHSDIIKKLKFLNNSKIAFAIPASMLLALSNQYINKQLTKKRTGIDNFVGENGYENNVADKKNKGKEKGLLAKKMLSAGVFLLMLSSVMGLKKPADLVRKLEFDGPATGGNAIKTIYGTLILGRIFASKDSTELRETNVRDYLGFLNWLVLGGFVSKGVAQALDPKQKNLFNISKKGSGITHWLKNVSLKSQKEIIAQGGNVKKNLRNLNIAQISGIAYSAIMLGVLLPKLNIWMTKHNKGFNLNPFKKNDDSQVAQQQEIKKQQLNFKSKANNGYISMVDFQKSLDNRKSYSA